MKRDAYGNVNALLLGYGGATHDGGYLTDSIIVVSRNPELGNISMFSIPRDLYVKSPVTNGYGRINAIFTQFMGRNGKDVYASASGTVAKIAAMLNMEIPYYATVDFTAFQGIIDAIGGIDIVVPETLHDTTYPNEANRGYITFHIDAGLQHLDGATALKYARSRHSTSDFSRSLRQQLIVMGIKEKFLGSGVSVAAAQQLYEQYNSYINTNVSLAEMLRTVQYLHALKDFTSFGFTTNCSFQNYLKMPAACFLYYPDRAAFGGASVMLPMGANVNAIEHYDQMQTFTRFILSHPAFVQQKASIEILNGIDKSLARSKGMASTPFAGQLAVKLKRYGFTVVNTENTPTPLS
ncbi:MAG: LCP family protein [Candidatus Peribacteria bacterium]|jgi:LCP family protein required for cell wall assembly|nr:LCP family protein [Candidatus Peribacteria bacterium]